MASEGDGGQARGHPALYPLQRRLPGARRPSGQRPSPARSMWRVCREDEFRITKAEDGEKRRGHRRRTGRHGGGRVCTLRGHKVTLYEKRELGGALIEASVPDFKAPDLKPLVSYLSTQMKKLKIKVIRKEATVQDIRKGGYDVAIVATGAAPAFSGRCLGDSWCRNRDRRLGCHPQWEGQAGAQDCRYRRRSRGNGGGASSWPRKGRKWCSLRCSTHS